MPGKTCGASRATEAELENAVSRELMRDPKAGDPENLSNRRKVELGERPRRDFGYFPREIIDFFKGAEEHLRVAPERGRPGALRDTKRSPGAPAKRSRAAGKSIATGARGPRFSQATGPIPPPTRISEREIRRAMQEGGMAARRTKKRLAYDSYAGEADESSANVPLAGGRRPRLPC